MLSIIRNFLSKNKGEKHYIEAFNINSAHINSLNEKIDSISDSKKYLLLQYIVHVFEKKMYEYSIDGLKKCGYNDEKKLLDFLFTSCSEASWYIYGSLDRNINYSFESLFTVYRLNYGDRYKVEMERDISVEVKKHIKNFEFD
jgi:hypothetical protein